MAGAVATLRRSSANAVGLRHKGEHLIKGMCPPYYDSMSEAVDAVVAEKFGPQGIYRDRAVFGRIYKGDYGDRYLAEASDYAGDVIECTRDICNYIYEHPWALSRPLRDDPCPRHLDPGPPCRGGLLRSLLQERPDAGAQRPPARLALMSAASIYQSDW